MKRTFCLLLVLAACGEGPTKPPPPTNYRVDISGSGSGGIVSNPNGLNCTLSQGAAGGTCSANFTTGQTIALTATAASDWEFLSWSGVSCGLGSVCQFVLSQNVGVSAVFDRSGGPGPMRLDLGTSPAGTAGLLLAISGGTFTAITAAPGYQIQSGALTGSPVLLLVRGNLAPGKLADLQVADRKAAFAVTVQAASSGAAGGYTLLPVAPFTASILRP